MKNTFPFIRGVTFPKYLCIEISGNISGRRDVFDAVALKELNKLPTLRHVLCHCPLTDLLSSSHWLLSLSVLLSLFPMQLMTVPQY
ncbi:hypothetical protein FKM82_030947 [Ascaphus truei]